MIKMSYLKIIILSLCFIRKRAGKWEQRSTLVLSAYKYRRRDYLYWLFLSLKQADDNRNTQPHAETSSGPSQQTTRLHDEDPKARVLIGYHGGDSNTGRTSYLFDEFESHNSLC